MTTHNSPAVGHSPDAGLLRFKHDHARLTGLADALKALLRRPTPCATRELASGRWGFAYGLLQGLATKERYIYAKLERDPRPSVVDFSNASKRDLLSRFETYTRHVDEWPTTRAVQDWQGYGPRAIVAIETLLERLQWEERELCAFVVAHRIDVTQPVAATSNWVRNAFAIKQHVEQGQ